MATAIIRPTSHINYYSSSSMFTNPEYMYDQNENTYTESKGLGSCVVQGFDTSQIANSIRAGGKLTNMTLHLLVSYRSSGYYMHTRCITGVTRVSSLELDNANDCGDGKIRFVVPKGPPPTWVSIPLPKAAAYCNNNIESFLTGKLQISLEPAAAGRCIYEVYLSVEYEEPNIYVTTLAQPPEGGIVTGGGTYESGATVTATATPNDGYKFSHWLVNGADLGSINPISGVLIANTTVVAVFDKILCPEISSVQITPNPCNAGQGFIISVGFTE